MRVKLISFDGWEEAIADKSAGRRESNRPELMKVQKLLRLAIERELTPRQRECVRLYFYDRLTEEEIGRSLGIGKSTVCRHLQKAKARLYSAMRYTELGLRAEPTEKPHGKTGGFPVEKAPRRPRAVYK